MRSIREMPMSQSGQVIDDAIRVYWQPGCTSCLRTKEFLTRHGVPFLSRNVLGDEGAYDELKHFGLRQVPIVTRGKRWANGQVLTDVAELVGIQGLKTSILPVTTLHERATAVLEGAERFYRQFPDERLKECLPNRPRHYTDLTYHIFNNVDAFLEEKAGIPLTFDSYNRFPEPGADGRADVLAYAEDVQRRFATWMSGPGRDIDWTARADVYYGEQSQHQFLERTTWHSGQHVRQLMWALERMGIAPSSPLTAETFAGLPMPEKVWDDEAAA
jgi:glutaredoxin